MLLKNKICIVTGAGKGFGREIAKEFYAQGAKLALITRSQSDINNLNSEFDSGRVLSVCGDVSDSTVVAQFITQTIDKFGTIDVLVNNAGMRFRKEFLEISEDEYVIFYRTDIEHEGGFSNYSFMVVNNWSRNVYHLLNGFGDNNWGPVTEAEFIGENMLFYKKP